MIDDLDMVSMSRLHVVRKYRVEFVVLCYFVHVTNSITTLFNNTRMSMYIYIISSTVLFYKSFLNVGFRALLWVLLWCTKN